MGKNYRETLAEQMKDPEFKKVWDAGAAERERLRSLQVDSTLTMEDTERIPEHGNYGAVLLQESKRGAEHVDDRMEYS